MVSVNTTGGQNDDKVGKRRRLSGESSVASGSMDTTASSSASSDGTVASQIKHARYLSIMIDGDTDVSTKECEVVYVRLIEDRKPVNKLVGQKEVQHAHAC